MHFLNKIYSLDDRLSFFRIMCTIGGLGRYISVDISVDSRSTVGRLSTDYQPIIGRQLTDIRQIVPRYIGRLSTDASAVM